MWYAPLQALGGTHWPLSGFIYASKPKPGEAVKERTAKPKPGRTVPGDDDPIATIIKRELAI